MAFINESFDLEQSFDLESIFQSTVTTAPITYSQEGATELGQITAPLVGTDSQSIAQELLNGDTSGLLFAKQSLADATYGEIMRDIEMNVLEAETPEEVAFVLEEGQYRLEKPISVADLRSRYAISEINPSTGRVPAIDERAERNAVFKEELEKRQQKLWDDASFTSILKDFGEIVIPTGIATEEWNKYETSLNDVLTAIRNAPEGEQEQAFNALVDKWMETETLLLSRNNTVLTIDQLEGLREAITEGGLGFIDGSTTEAEAQDRIESALNATFFAGEVVAIGKGLRGIMGFLSSRIFPKRQVVDETDKITVDLNYDTRGNTNTADIVAIEKPRLLYNQSSGKDLQTLAVEQGLTNEELAARMIPTPSPDTDLGVPPQINQVNELILMDVDAADAGIKRGLQLQKESGGTLYLREDATAIIPNAVENSIGDFKFLFGDLEDGFATRELAEQAMIRGLVGVDRKQVVEKGGKFFIEAQLEHSFNPRMDTTDLLIDVGEEFASTEFVLDPLRRLGEDVLSGVFALKGYNRSIANKMQNELEDIFGSSQQIRKGLGVAGLSTRKTKNLLKALEETNKDGNDWFRTIDDFSGFLRMPSSQVKDEWFRYMRVHKLMNEVYNIRNSRYRRTLLADNIKYIDIDEGNLGKVVTNTEGKKVYVPDTGELVDTYDDLTVVRLNTPIPDRKGNLRSYVAINPEKVKELPRQVLNQRKGHIDRFYRDAGWTVKVGRTRVVDDVEQAYESTTHIVQTQKEANEVVAKLKQENPDLEVRALRSRENDELDTIYGDSNSVQFGYAGTHTKQRGEVLKGSDGLEAPTAGAIESLSRSIAGVERQLDTDMVNSLRQRFLRQFEPYLAKKGGTPYSARLSDMLDTRTIPADVANAAKQWHNYIEGISRIKQGEFFAQIDDLLAGTLGRMIGIPYNTQKVSSVLQNLTTQLIIVGRPLFQIPQNLMQMAYVAMKYPVAGAKNAYRIPAVTAALAKETPNNLKLVSTALGISDKAAKELVQEIRGSGIWDAVGMSDDFLRMIQRSSVEASPNALTAGSTKLKNTILAPLRVSQSAQEKTLRLVNLAAYLAEYDTQVLKAGKAYNAKTKADIAFQMQKLTQTQNSVNQFAYQDKSEIWSLMFQFSQHVHKLYLDIVADPVYKAVVGKNIGKTASPFASSRVQAAGTLAATYMLFGPAGILGSMGGEKAKDWIAQIENPYIREGLEASLLNEMVNGAARSLGAEGNVDVASKMNPASFLESLYTFHIESVLDGNGLNVFGATGYMSGMVGDLFTSVNTIAGAPTLDPFKKLEYSLREITSVVAGISDAEKAYMAYNMGVYTYRGTLSGSLPVTQYEAIMQAFNLAPAVVEDRFAEISSTGGEKTKAEKIARVWARQMHRELADANSLEEMLVIANDFTTYAKASVDPIYHNEVTGALGMYTSDINNQNYFQYILPYINSKDVGDSIFELRALRQEAGTEEMQKQIDEAIEFLEPLANQIQEFYEEE